MEKSPPLWIWPLPPALAWALVFPVAERDFLWAPGIFLAGALVAAIQAPLIAGLTGRARDGRLWHGAGLLGWGLASAFLAAIPYSLNDGLALSLTVAAPLPVGALQGWILRRSLPHSWRWTAVPSLALLTAVLGSVALHNLVGLDVRASLPAAILVGSLFGALYGAAEGTALALVLRPVRRFEAGERRG